MSPEIRRQALALFTEYLDSGAGNREDFLARSCGRNADLRAELERLLDQHDGAGRAGFLEKPLSPIQPWAQESLIGQKIGPYRVLEILGEGGMGIVYLAEQISPIHRRVALKIIKAGMDTREVTARFETEREALAMMNHPNVARVYDAGATERGRPYFAMEYVQGIPITDYCDKHRLNTEERLRLFMDVCQAVQHAHQKGIIHRDIKPSNVLVTMQDGKPFPKVIDFGVAKATQHRLTERTLFTEQGQLIGTPGYMSPEQAEMKGLDVDTRTDVYSLGVLLYELLVGALPFDTELLLRAGFGEIQRIIREVDPSKPSTRLSALSEPRTSVRADARSAKALEDCSVAPIRDSSRSKDRGSLANIAHSRRTEPKTLIRMLRGDLDWIVMKCLEKDRTRRYDSANDLAMELARHLNNEPVLAGPPSSAYRIRKFVRRNRAGVIAALLVAVAVMIGFAGTATALVWANAAEARAVREASEAKRQATAARQVTDFLVGVFKGSDPSEGGGDKVKARDILDRGDQKLVTELTDQPRLRAQLMQAIGGAYTGLSLYEPADRLLKESLRLLEAEEKIDPEELLSSLDRLVDLYWYRADYEEADKVFERMEKLAVATYGNADERTTLIRVKRNQIQQLKNDPLGVEKVAIQGVLLFVPALDVKLWDSEAAVTMTEIQRLLRNNDLEGAVRHLTQYWHGRLDVIRAHARQGNMDRALDEISRFYTPLLKNPLLKSSVPAMLQSTSVFLENRGDFLCAECFARLALVMAESTNANPLEFQALRRSLANMLMIRGYHEDAERMYRECLEGFKELVGGDHPSVVGIMTKLASLLAGRDDYAEAERLYREALRLLEKRPGSDDAVAAATRGALAEVLAAQSNVDEAEPMARESLSNCQKKIQKAGSCTFAMSRLARILESKGDLDEAQKLFGQALVATRKQVGPSHPAVADILISLAKVSHRQGAFSEAERLAREALGICERNVELDPSPAAKKSRDLAQVALGNALSSLKRFKEAEPLIVMAVNLLQETEIVPPSMKINALEDSVRFYETWDSAEPGKGHAKKVAEWRKRLDELNAETKKSQNATTAGSSP